MLPHHVSDPLPAFPACLMPSPSPLPSGLLASPQAMKRLTAYIAGRDALIVPGVVGPEEMAIAAFLGAPVLGPDYSVAMAYGSKSGSKRIFALAEVATFPGLQPLRAGARAAAVLRIRCAGTCEMRRIGRGEEWPMIGLPCASGMLLSGTTPSFPRSVPLATLLRTFSPAALSPPFFSCLRPLRTARAGPCTGAPARGKPDRRTLACQARRRGRWAWPRCPRSAACRIQPTPLTRLPHARALLWDGGLPI